MSSLIVEICKVEEIFKHPNADRLSVVRIKNWFCIVGLDQYKVGDLVVFCPPDSIIPNNLIEKYNLEYLKHNGRVGTTKLRGYLSQGLVMDLPEGNWYEGDDVSELLGIQKWQPPEPKYSVSGAQQTSRKKINPNFGKYTDIENIKNYNDIFKDGDEVIISEKLHGSNMRAGRLEIIIGKNIPLLDKISMWIKKNIFHQKYEFCVGSHNVQITNHSNRHSFYEKDIWSQMAKKYNMKDILPEDYIVYSEVFGIGIQDLTYGLNDIDLRVFDVKYKDKYLGWDDMVKFCEDRSLPIVPVLYIGKFSQKILEECTIGNSLLCPTQIREGCVTKMFHEENHPAIGRKILKSLNPDYLLRKNGTEFQ